MLVNHKTSPHLCESLEKSPTILIPCNFSTIFLIPQISVTSIQHRFHHPHLLRPSSPSSILHHTGITIIFSLPATRSSSPASADVSTLANVSDLEQAATSDINLPHCTEHHRLSCHQAMLILLPINGEIVLCDQLDGWRQWWQMWAC